MKIERKKAKIVLLDISYLHQLLSDDRCGVTIVNSKLHISLHPFYTKNFNISVKEVLNQKVAKYNAELEGIILGFENVRVCTSFGRILNDDGITHVDVEADFFIFKPVVGLELKGTVNKKSNTHLGCLVHKLFNVSLPKLEDEDDWIGNSVHIGQEVLFTITTMNMKGRLPFMQGSIICILTDPDSGISTSEENVKGIHTNFTYDECEDGDNRKKKKRRKSVTVIKNEDNAEEETYDAVPVIDATIEKRKIEPQLDPYEAAIAIKMNELRYDSVETKRSKNCSVHISDDENEAIGNSFSEKKRKKKVFNGSMQSPNETCSEEESIKKKKKRKSNNFDIPIVKKEALDLDLSEELGNSFTKEKKKKKVFDETFSEEDSVKKKKKSIEFGTPIVKKERLDYELFKEPESSSKKKRKNLNLSEEVLNSFTEKKSKKKISDASMQSTNENVSEEDSTKKKKKRKFNEFDIPIVKKEITDYGSFEIPDPSSRIKRKRKNLDLSEFDINSSQEEPVEMTLLEYKKKRRKLSKEFGE